ncbi:MULTISPECIES: ATP-binding protein [unclassified Pseudomonas]|uniref:ATP-binding protein n=1 Tax=unclassified Pseudomonas TaxID=196821 RepID=UPI002448B850|nr:MULTISPECIES: ATP-binding protein [unclassified Pseudomonas]MDH0896183.1 ATP-binding protein [Pseudomonas sp. GD03875]MDH1066041.1 ATP-binding protein [Pseudomonas sp. GD03985]
MMRRADSLFARLFGVFLAAILLAHGLAFLWFSHYGRPPPPPPTAQHEALRPPPPGPNIHGPLIVLGFQLLTLIVAAWYGARLLSRPIRHLSRAAERLSDDLDSPPLPETGPQEARQAAHAFNLMQRRIREQVQQRARMLAAVSHDLRTPLARLKLRVEQIPNPQLRVRMGQDLGEMIGMLDATLRYLHEQRSSEALQWLDLQALLESMVEDAQDRGAEVSFHGHCAPLRVQPLALRSCVSNLLENALRYAGHASVELHDSPTGVEVRVVDRGPGIAPEQREAVFEAFFRIEGSRNRSSGGVGLGLTIAREAARRQGGDVLLEETRGGGLTAILRLPR